MQTIKAIVVVMLVLCVASVSSATSVSISSGAADMIFKVIRRPVGSGSKFAGQHADGAAARPT